MSSLFTVENQLKKLLTLFECEGLLFLKRNTKGHSFAIGPVRFEWECLLFLIYQG